MPKHSPPSSPSSARPIKITKMDDGMDLDTATTEVTFGNGHGHGSASASASGTMSGSQTPGEASYRPDAKARRYDRQLRLWASAGQRSLEAARVLLVGADATGSQALKNLVLPGIAHFTIMSPNKVTSRDVATNFFMHPESIGADAAVEVVRYLKELNPAVEGAAEVADPFAAIQSKPDFFSSFTLIIASNLEPRTETALAELLWKVSESVGGPDIPLIAVRNSGFVGRVEIQLREHCVSDSHPDQTHTLRVDQPFPALEQYARELALDKMDSMEHSHVPWVVLLAKAVGEWKEQHDGALPSSDDDAQRVQFKELIRSWMVKPDEENFEEALAQAYRGWTRSQLDWTVEGLLEHPAVKSVSVNNLHLLLHALSQYLLVSPHLPPLSPALPDMHSSTTSYIALQNLFKAQFQADLTRFKGDLAGTLDKVGLPADAIPEDEVESFARNVGAVGIVKGSSLVERKGVNEALKELYGESFPSDGDGDGSVHLALHLALLASERFFLAKGRWPGAGSNDEVEEDKTEVQGAVLVLIKEAAADAVMGEQMENAIAEVVRGGFGCLPNTAAFLGGIVAQEAIKLVTNQYMPLDNTVVADLVTSSLEKIKL